jgi:hypothetical protein
VRVRTLVVGGVGTLVTIGLVIAGTVAANSVPVRAPSPGTGYTYSVDWADLPTVAQWPVYGGWENQTTGKMGRTIVLEGSSLNPTLQHRQAVGTLSEPFMELGSMTVRMSWDGVKDSRAGTVYNTPVATGTFTTTANAVQCGATEWTLTSSLTALTSTYVGSYSSSFTLGSAATVHQEANHQVTAIAPTTHSCNRLSAVSVNVCGIQNNDFAAGQRCTRFVWKAETWWNQGLYTDPTRITDLCKTKTGKTSVDCAFIGTGDGTTFEAACPDVPPLSATDWSTLPTWFGYMAGCLFLPLNGFDPLGLLPAAWAGTAGGQVLQPLGDMFAAYHISETCGVIWNVPAHGFWPAINMNTCSWSWAAGLKGFLYAFIIAVGYYGVVRFIISIVVGLMNKKTPHPLEGVSLD